MQELLTELIFTFLESVLIFFFIDQFLNCKFKGYKKIIFLSAAIIVDALFVHFCSLEPTFRSIFLIVVSFLIVQLLYKNSFFIIMFFILLINYIFVISDIIAGNILSWIYGANINFLISGTLSLFLFSKIIVFLLVLLYIQVFKEVDFNIPDRYWVYMDLIIGFFIIIMNFLMMISSTLQNESFDYSVRIAGVSMIFLLMSVLTICIFGEICLFYQKEHQRYSLDLKNKMLEQQLAFQEAATSDLKKIRHDIKNNLANISYLLNENHIEDSVKYINAITSALEATKSVIHCGNNYLDAILNYVLTICKSNNIDTKFEIDKIPKLNIDPTDLSSIFSNILSNAVEANLKLMDSKRYISLKVFCYKNYLSAIVKNPYNYAIIEADGMPKTNKEDKLYHGYGLKSVKSSVERYGGIFKYSYEGNVYTSIIMLPLTSDINEK